MTFRELIPLLRRTPVQAVLITAAAVAYLGHLQFLTPFICETDGYYHMKVAYLLRTTGILREFPWATFSLWSEQFFDKDFGYHLLLSLFAGGDLVLGAKVGAVTFGTLFFLSFFLVVRLSGRRHAWLWTLLLLVGSGSYFGWRVDLTRPHIWSMTLALWAMFCVLKGAPRALFGVSSAWALSYTAPHVAIGYAALCMLSQRLVARRWLWRPIVAATLGVAAGWLAHPNFPANFVAFKVQIIDVLMSAWRLSGPNLHLGGELAPAPFWSFLLENLLPLSLVAAAAWCYWRLRPRLDAEIVTLMAATLGFFVLTCISKRFVEYWMPLSFWTCAWFFDDLGPRWSKLLPAAVSRRPWREVVVLGVALAVIGLCGRSYSAHRTNYSDPKASGEEPAARWLLEHTPENSQVFTCDWDDAPELFFYNHHNRYLVFLDPSYLYRWRPDLWELWDNTANARVKESPADIIRKTFGARYGFCTHDFTPLYSRLERDPRVTFRSKDGNGYVFEIADGPTPPEPAPVRTLAPGATPLRALDRKSMKILRPAERQRERLAPGP
jgi:hypothetical protein